MSNVESHPDDIFMTTRWTIVQRASSGSVADAERALEEICQTYWFPLYAYIRRRGQSPEDAEDLTQAFFQQLLEKRWIENADRDKGKLRAFLITALKHFMAKEWRKESAQKRGGGERPLSLDSRMAEGRYASTGTPQLKAASLFDRQWALTLLDLTMQRLEQDYTDSSKAALFAQLKDGLVIQTPDYSTLAAKLGMSEGAVRVAVHRLRKRFRELYRAEVAQTLPDGADLDEEINHLSASLINNG